MPQPYRAHSTLRDDNTLFGKLIGGSQLAVGGVLYSHAYYCLLYMLSHSVLEYGLLAGDFDKRFIPAVFVQLFVTVEGVATVAHYFARLGDVA